MTSQTVNKLKKLAECVNRQKVLIETDAFEESNSLAEDINKLIKRIDLADAANSFSKEDAAAVGDSLAAILKQNQEAEKILSNKITQIKKQLSNIEKKKKINSAYSQENDSPAFFDQLT